MQKVYVVDLDAINGAALKKIEEVQQKMLVSSDRMSKAYDRVNASLQAGLNKSGTAISNFSKRDLGMFSSQLLASANVTGKLGSQLSNLASGLLMGGWIGAAFAGFTAIINLMGRGTEDLTKNLQELIKVQSTKGTFNVLPGNIPEAIELLKKELAELNDPRVKLPGFQGMIWGSGQRESLEEAIKILETEGKQVQETNKIINTLKQAGLTYTEKEVDAQKKITTEKQKQLEILNKSVDPKASQFNFIQRRAKGAEGTPFWEGLGMAGEVTILKKPEPLIEGLEEAKSPMSALVSLSNQMASNFSFAGHTFVGQLSQAIAMVDSISNMILTIASIFGSTGGGFGIGGLLSLIFAEKGGRITNLGGNISYTKIPSFAMGGSYSTPGISGPFGGGYPVMVHKNETLDVYNSGQTSKMERALGEIKNAIVVSNLHLSRKGKGGGVTNVYLDGKKLFEINQAQSNRASRSGKNVQEIL